MGRGERRKPATFVTQLNQCVKDSNPDCAMRLFEQQIAEDPAFLSMNAFCTLLSLLSDRPSDSERVFAVMLQRGLPDDERTVTQKLSEPPPAARRHAGVATLCSQVTLRVRMLGKCGKLAEAFEHIRHVEANGITLKTRTYSSLLQGLCEHGDAERAHALLALMKGRPSTAPGEADFLNVAALEAARGEHEGLEVQLRALHEATPQLQPSSFEALHAALNRPSSGYIVHTAAVDQHGVCSSCGAGFPAIALSTEHKIRLRDAILAAAAEREESVREDLVRFDEWLRSRSSPSRYIIDGANVGYRNQNFEGGSFSFVQVEIARQELVRRACGTEPLFVLPGHYFDDVVPNHSSTATGAHSVTVAERVLLSGWVGAGAVWRCPAGADDDWYWMLAAVEGGTDVRVLTNDEMRDHSFQMTLPPYFQRWKRRHVVKYDFSHGAALGRPDPAITLSEPPAFACEIHSCASGKWWRWHFPSGPDCTSWLCAQRLGAPDEVMEAGDRKRLKINS